MNVSTSFNLSFFGLDIHVSVCTVTSRVLMTSAVLFAFTLRPLLSNASCCCITSNYFMLWERTLIFALRAHIMFIIRLKKNVSDTSYAAIGSFQLNEMMQVHNGHECTVLHASMKC